MPIPNTPEGADKYQNLFGTLYQPESETPIDLAEQLLRLGLAKSAEWSMAMLPRALNGKLGCAREGDPSFSRASRVLVEPTG